MLECEIAAPKSLTGRTVYVYFDEQDVTECLLMFKDAAREARMNHE